MGGSRRWWRSIKRCGGSRRWWRCSRWSIVQRRGSIPRRGDGRSYNVRCGGGGVENTRAKRIVLSVIVENGMFIEQLLGVLSAFIDESFSFYERLSCLFLQIEGPRERMFRCPRWRDTILPIYPAFLTVQAT